jgi:hypothetical protein
VVKYLVALIALSLAACEKQRPPDIYLLPDSFRGWILIEYERPDCPPLAEHDGARYFDIPANGRYCTSATLESGWAHDRFYYGTAKGRRELPWREPGHGGMVWSGSTGTCSAGNGPAVKFQQYLIEPEADIEKAPPEPTIERCSSKTG